jgi:Rod binding domain-containing protein
MGTSMPSTGTLTSQSNLQQVKEMQLLQQLNSAKASPDDAKIEKGAKQFEAMLLSSWLQQAEQSFATVPGADDDQDDPGKQQMMSFGVQSLADSMAASGGIGIAKMIAKAMHAQADRANEASQARQAVASEAPDEQIDGKNWAQR